MKYLAPLSLALLCLVSIPAHAATFAVGDTVQTTAKVNIRATPTTNGKPLGTQKAGAQGKITAGPTVAKGYTWWSVDYATGVDGWTADTYLTNLSSPTTPPPPPAPPPSSTTTPPVSGGAYPDSVVAQGLQSVWDNRTTAGLTSQPTLNPVKDFAKLPPGTYINQIMGTTSIDIEQNADFTGWDFTGYEVFVGGNVTVNFTNTLFRDGGYALLDMGTNGGSPTVTCTHCEFDGKGVEPHFESIIRPYGGTTFTLQNSYLHNAPNDYISVVSPNKFTATNNYIRTPGVGLIPGAHLENFHIYTGTAVVSQNVFDNSDGVAAGLIGGFTGIVYPEADQGNISLTMDKNIVTSMDGLPMYWLMQFSTSSYGNSVSMTNNLLSKGSSGYIANCGVPFTQSNNHDFTTGVSILNNPVTYSSNCYTAYLSAAGAADIHGFIDLIATRLRDLIALLHG